MAEENSKVDCTKLEEANVVETSGSNTIDTNKNDSVVTSQVSMDSYLRAETKNRQAVEIATPIPSPNYVINSSPFTSPNFNCVNSSTPLLKKLSTEGFLGHIETDGGKFSALQHINLQYNNYANKQPGVDVQKEPRLKSNDSYLSETNSRKSMENTFVANNNNMLCFNPYKYGYTNASQGLNPEEGYVFVYPYVPSYNFQFTRNESAEKKLKVKLNKAQKYKKTLCC